MGKWLDASAERWTKRIYAVFVTLAAIGIVALLALGLWGIRQIAIWVLT